MYWFVSQDSEPLEIKLISKPTLRNMYWSVQVCLCCKLDVILFYKLYKHSMIFHTLSVTSIQHVWKKQPLNTTQSEINTNIWSIFFCLPSFLQRFLSDRRGCLANQLREFLSTPPLLVNLWRLGGCSDINDRWADSGMSMWQPNERLQMRLWTRRKEEVVSARDSKKLPDGSHLVDFASIARQNLDVRSANRCYFSICIKRKPRALSFICVARALRSLEHCAIDERNTCRFIDRNDLRLNGKFTSCIWFIHFNFSRYLLHEHPHSSWENMRQSNYFTAKRPWRSRNGGKWITST